jgi:hypothetical protein
MGSLEPCEAYQGEENPSPLDWCLRCLLDYEDHLESQTEVI